jgi:ribonucleoside-diphosphate reductase alpha chain
LGTAISLALQYGVPVESIVNKFAHQRFEPMGMTTNSDIPFAKSLVDYIFRWLGMQFISGYREHNAPRRGKPADQISGEHGAGSTGAVGQMHDVKEDAPWADRLSGGSLEFNSAPMGGPSAGFHAPLPSAQEKSGASPMVGDRTFFGSAADSMLGSLGGAIPSASGRPKQALNVGPDGRAATDSVLDQSNAQLMGDAPACDVCGSITVRNGTCYRCLNCGQSMGCS